MTPNLIDWQDREGFLAALEEQADRYRRFRDNNEQPDDPKAAQQCNGCALSVRVFGVDIEINDRQRQLAIAKSNLNSCHDMQWQGRPLTNTEMSLVSEVLFSRVTSMSKLRGKDPKLAKPARPQVVVFGQPGIGKTWTALDFPACYYIDCEGGANLSHYTDKLKKVGASYLGPEDGANDFDVVVEEVRTLATVKHDRKTLIIDSFSKLFNTAVQVEHDRLIAAGITPSFGSEKKPAIANTRRLLRWLTQLDMNAILICHSKTKWNNGEALGTEADVWEKTMYDMNLVVEVFKAGNTRKCKVIKSRFMEFKESEIVDWSYEEFATRFGKSVMESSSIPVDSATAEQVATVRELCEVQKVAQAHIQKVWEDAGVTRWEDMSFERIEKAINNLQAKMRKVGA